MKTLKIKKLEMDRGGDCYAVTFETREEIGKDDFDLDQLGSDITYISSFRDMVMVAGNVTLKAGDSITDDFGGEPIIGETRKDAEKKDFGAAYRPLEDYRDAFQQKITGRGEK